MNKAEILNQRLLKSETFKKLLKEYRLSLKIPINGFTSTQAECAWMKKRPQKASKLVDNFLLDVYKKFAFVPEEFTSILLDYLLNGETKRLANLNLTGCDLVVVRDDKISKVDDRISQGLYIKVSPRSSFSDLKKFIQSERYFIQVYKKLFLKELGLTLNKVRKETHSERDEAIYFLSCCTREELTEWGGGTSKYKEIQISNLLLKDLKLKITSENVRRVISREKKLRT